MRRCIVGSYNATIFAVVLTAVGLFIIPSTPSIEVDALQQLIMHENSIKTVAHATNRIPTTISRREWIQQSSSSSSWIVAIGTSATVVVVASPPLIVNGAEFAPGGTFISDKEIGILVNNPNASPLRKYDNSNVLFDKDYYYKFGTGIQYIEPPGNTSFPKTMPFTKSQQRYDALKKYRERIMGALLLLQSLPKTDSPVADPTSKEDVYQLRAMGLLANGLLASDNNGLPNEVFVARYYINEIYLRLIQLMNSSTLNDSKERQIVYSCIEKATNSYLTLMNRAITTKVGEPFPYIKLV
jgi:hypothetical protein